MKVVTCFLLCIMVRQVVSQTGLSRTDEQQVLDAHNKYRGMVIPTASNMQRMVWSSELAQVAQNYAENCVFGHNSNRLSQQTIYRSVGENIFAGSGNANFSKFVEIWYNEVEDYNFDSNSCSGTCGHYTQIVWASSQSVGCGAFRCAQLVNAGSNWVFFVCNYGPAGNFRGRHPYVAGASCSDCSEEQPFCVTNACSKESGGISAMPSTLSVAMTIATKESGGISATPSALSIAMTIAAALFITEMNLL